jgi:hypothetical protein
MLWTPALRAYFISCLQATTTHLNQEDAMPTSILPSKYILDDEVMSKEGRLAPSGSRLPRGSAQASRISAIHGTWPVAATCPRENFVR